MLMQTCVETAEHVDPATPTEGFVGSLLPGRRNGDCQETGTQL